MVVLGHPLYANGEYQAAPDSDFQKIHQLLRTYDVNIAMAVDTHVFRVSNRTGIAPGANPDEVERKLVKFVADEFKLHAHHWLILHGRYICKARSPECWRCPVVDLCGFNPKLLEQGAKPAAAAKRKAKPARP